MPIRATRTANRGSRRITRGPGPKKRRTNRKPAVTRNRLNKPTLRQENQNKPIGKTKSSVADKTTKPRKNTNAVKPRMDDDKKKTGSSFLNRLGNAFNSTMNIKPNAEQRKALETMNKMLEPDKLGGKDKVFNHKDIDSVVKGLLNDRQGLVKEASGQLKKEGKNFQAKLVERAFSGRNNRIKSKVQQKVRGEVSNEVKGQLKNGLNEAKVDPNKGGPIDNQGRSITFQELRDFDAASKVMQDFQKQVSERLGFDVNFPNGISQAAIQHTLQGKFGIPPGGVVAR